MQLHLVPLLLLLLLLLHLFLLCVQGVSQEGFARRRRSEQLIPFSMKEAYTAKANRRMCNLNPDERLPKIFHDLCLLLFLFSLRFFHTLVDTHNSMLSGNCSVNATIITFNAPIKSRDSERKRDRQRERVSESVRARGKSGFNQRSAFYTQQERSQVKIGSIKRLKTESSAKEEK